MLRVKALITGAGGQVGRALLKSVPSYVEVSAVTREQLDIRDADAVRRMVEAVHPHILINAAAYTAVDKAESEPEVAAQINTTAPCHLAEAALRIPGCRVIHISTDYVFDGRSATPYKTGDAPNPLNVYGRTKLEGERGVLAALGARAVVLRTAWVYAAQGRNFLLTMLRLMRERGFVRVVADQHGSPTTAASIARAIWRIVDLPHVQGVLHWTNMGVASWYDFARAIAEDATAAGLLAQPIQVTPITTADYPTPARRPANSVLDTAESAEILGLTPAPWRAGLRATLRELV